MRTTLNELVLSLNSRSGRYLNETTFQQALKTLTSEAVKIAYAEELLREEQEIFAIPADRVSTLAAALANPSERDGVVTELYSFGYANSKIDWAGTGITITMDRVFSDRRPTDPHVAIIPAGWSLEVWSSDSDLTEEGRVFQHWVTATLPSIPAESYDEPLRFVLLSPEIYGTLRWGGHSISVGGDDVLIETEDQNRMLWDLLSRESAARPV